MRRIILVLAVSTFLFSCGKDDDVGTPVEPTPSAVEVKFNGEIDLENLDNYANQVVPNYITKDNSLSNAITDKGATLGRVLFYDKELSADRTVSCSSCHKQELAFTDNAVQSEGINGVTGRHSMRLVNNRFAEEVKYFWDERAPSLMAQSTMPIQDHVEMGFSGADGDLDFDDLIDRLEALEYYQELFTFVYGDAVITEDRIQRALAQFVSSIQSFDSKYDQGRTQVNAENVPFPNFTTQENLGKRLFLIPPQFNNLGQRTGGGLGCAGCHRPPEFDIDPLSRNNGSIGNLNGGVDFTNTKSPSLRDIVDNNGVPHSGFMHTANFTTLEQVLEHYNFIFVTNGNNNIDPRLTPAGQEQRLMLQPNEVAAVVAFLATLTGENVYTDEKWSNPF